MKVFEPKKLDELPKNLIEFTKRFGAVVNAEADGHNGLTAIDIANVMINGLVQYTAKLGLEKDVLMEAVSTTWDLIEPQIRRIEAGLDIDDEKDMANAS